MPAKVIFDKQYIIDSTYDLIAKVGHKDLTARSIAKHMKASTAPIYNCFNSIDELVEECLSLGLKKLIDSTNTEYADQLFINIGLGIITFARDNPNMYSAIILDQVFFKKVAEKEIKKLMNEAKNDPRFIEINLSDLDELMDKMWTYIFGLSTFVALGLINNLENSEILRRILNISSLFIGDALYGAKILQENSNLG